jgi:hypothetical protein
LEPALVICLLHEVANSAGGKIGHGHGRRSGALVRFMPKADIMYRSKKSFNTAQRREAPRIVLCAFCFRKACWRLRPELADMEPSRRSRKHNMLPASAAKSHRSPYIHSPPQHSIAFIRVGSAEFSPAVGAGCTVS